ncbi:MAG: radical SAM protein [Lachnospiraceae bacterium]|nr:radical SAM protein [Lachnospiraceae bacterium]
MELYETGNLAEKFLQRKADETKTPLGGSIELLPLCNMNCKMCYVRKSKAEMDAEGQMLTCDEWLRIAEEGCRMGILSLLLTGGEPLLYPEFKRLYVGLSKMGIILSVNTNGTLIDEEWADFFAQNGVRRINITLYGKDDATYGTLCGNPEGFTQVMRAADLLKEKKVNFRFTCSVTPDNKDQLSELYRIANSFDVPFAPAVYMFPASRRGKNADEQYRLSPEQAGAMVIESYHYKYPNTDLVSASKQTLENMKNSPRLKDLDGFSCHAGRSGFWLNWKGDMTACGMFSLPSISLKTHSFAEGWDYIVKACKQMPHCEKCKSCEKQNICQVCPAMCYTETGGTDGCPDYLCKMTGTMIREMERLTANEF